jgi:subtilisin family serine protease
MRHNRLHAGRLLSLVAGLIISIPMGPLLAAPSDSGQTASAAAIRLSTATFRPGLGERPAIPPGLSVAGYAKGQRGYYIVQFAGPVLADWKAEVEAQGAELLEYIPDFAFKARMNPGQARKVAEQDAVSWVGIFQPAFKLRPGMLDAESEQLYRVRVHRGAEAALARSQVLATGARLFGGSGESFVVRADAAQLEAMARVLDVGWIERFEFRQKHNEYAGAIVGANTSHANGYDGSGQTVAVADTGLGTGTASGAHPSIDPGRIVTIHDRVGVSDDPSCYVVSDDGAHDVASGHGTHVAVSAVGAGNAIGVGEGTAPGAKLVFQAVENLVQFQGLCSLSLANDYYLFGIPYDIRELFQQAYDDGARVHSDSWGSPNLGQYDIDSFYVDDFIWNHPDMTIAYSAGNSGDDFDYDGYADTAVISGPNERHYLSTPATAKNLITVGASENDRQGNYDCDPVATNCEGVNDIFWYGWAWPLEFGIGPIAGDLTAGNAEQMAGFSSRGPTHDNRIKPDIVAPGTWILSGYSDMYQEFYDPAPNPATGRWQSGGWFDPMDAEYKYFGGTSMSTPLVAGGAAVVRQYYQVNDNHNASAALVKATLINSAVDLLDENNDDFDDNDIPIPNNHEGWGRMDLDRATDGSHVYEDEAAGIGTGGSMTYQYTVTGSATPFRVSLVWSDFPSSETASSNLVNDLDLQVVAPGGQAYSGNVFAAGWSQTGGSADRTNNLENVYIAAPAVGQWRVTVSGYNVPNGPQPFALVVDGDLGGIDTGPSVALTNPTDAATVAGNVTLAADASDNNGVTQVAFDVNGSNVGTDFDGSDGWSTAWDTTSVADGGYTISATATDTAAQTRSDSIDVTVDNGQPPPPSADIHVADLDGASADAGKGKWTATVTIAISKLGGAPVDGASVTGSWSGGASGDSSCTTAGDGTCQVSKTIRNKDANASFSVNAVSHGEFSYDPDLNTDPDTDSDGTTISVSKDGGSVEPPPPPPGGPTMHVGSLDGSSASAPRNRWEASVTVVVHASEETGHGLLPGMTVSGNWSSGGGGSCSTGGDGGCVITRANIKGNVSSTTFSVTGIVDATGSYSYASGDNEADSVSINRP